ncbi:hypothetical protein NIES4102_43940 (plasmid) [Chondrocystis sp. NIES-4102]|nr:hypothetical protein NIES4102_43940 [Chondrocystis sp. NIES-4102]
MFDDVLKGAKASKKNQSEELRPQSSPSKIDPPQERKPRASQGKRTNPDFKQVGAYVRKDTYLQIQRLLLEQPDKDFSDLVQELLSTYLDNHLTG